MNPVRLKRWVDFGYFVPDFRAISGSTQIRLFSERDIQILRDILGRVDGGMPLGQAFDQRANEYEWEIDVNGISKKDATQQAEGLRL